MLKTRFLNPHDETTPLLCPQAFHEEYSRLFELSQEDSPLQSDVRLHHALVYYFQNQAPGRVIERALLEQFTDRNLSFDDRCCWAPGPPACA